MSPVDVVKVSTDGQKDKNETENYSAHSIECYGG